MPEARDHFECRYYAVQLGGWRLGRHRIGGGTYTVGPVSVNDCLALFRVSKDVNEALETHKDHLEQFTKRMPAATLKPLVPIMVRERIKPSHLRRATVVQVLAVIKAFHEANDFDYIVRAFAPSGEGTKGPRISLNALVHSIVTKCQVYTHAEARRLPMQMLLAIGDCEKEFQDAQKPPEDKVVPWTRDDYDLFASAGLTVH